ncbi:MAG: ribulokinase [Planctomycetota bacterium]
MTDDALVLGLDYGSDSMRALLVRARDGAELAAAVAPYPRWSAQRYCEPQQQQFRQHPQDYLDAVQAAVQELKQRCGGEALAQVRGIGLDTTGSTPCPVDADGRPLALDPQWQDEPDAMFWLWKDHSAVAEAEAINRAAEDFPGALDSVGGIYSSEWYWAKLLRCLRNGRVNGAVRGWVEHCDWLCAELCGQRGAQPRRSRCAAGHKAIWRDGQLPSPDFLAAVDPQLAEWRQACAGETLTCDQAVGGLSEVWAQALGLPAGISVASGAFDCHLGAVGAGIRPGQLAKVMGTSTCDIAIAEEAQLPGMIPGICGQVPGSVLPGLVGLEAGQSSFGDVYAWFARLLAWGREHDDGLIARLSEAAAELPWDEELPVALDWFNGRRTPDADQRLRAAIAGLHLGIDAPRLFRALVLGTACGARAIVDRFVGHGVVIDEIIALGGIALKNPYVMQMHADLLQRPIQVVASEQCCALGAAIAAATAAGLHPDIAQAQAAMASPVARTYRPQPEHVARCQDWYARYQSLAEATSCSKS